MAVTENTIVLADWTFHGYHCQAWNQGDRLWIVVDTHAPDDPQGPEWQVLMVL